MSGITLSHVEAYGGLFELYSKDRKFMQNMTSLLWANIAKASDSEVNFDGNYWNLTVLNNVNESYKAVNAGESTGIAMKQTEIFARYRPKLMYSRMELESIAAQKGYKGGRAAGKYSDDYVKNTFLSFLTNVSIDGYLSGNGYRATIATATAAATSFTVDTSQYLRPSMRLNWYNSALSVLRGTVQIAAKGIDFLNKTVYLESTTPVPVGATADDVLLVEDALLNAPSDGKYLSGLNLACDNSSTLGTLSPSDWAMWQAIVQNANGGNPSQEIFQTQFDLFQQISNELYDMMAIHPTQKKTYLFQYFNQRRFNTGTYDTGASSLSFSPVVMGNASQQNKPKVTKVLEDKNCPVTDVFFWVYDSVKLSPYYTKEPSIAAEDGRDWYLDRDFDTLEGLMRYWANIVYFMRNHVGKIGGFSLPSGTV